MSLIKTYENTKPLRVKTNTNLINAFLPGIVDEYGNKGAQLTITNLENSNIKLVNNIIDINALGVFTVYVDGINAPVYRCEIELSIKAKIGISSGPALSGALENISAKVKKTLLNSNPKIKTPTVETIIETINILFIPLLKELTKEDFKLNFPTVLGIKFENVTLDIKDHYFVVNYNFLQGGGRRGTFGGSNLVGGQRSTTDNRTSSSNQNGNFGGSRSTNTTNSSGTSQGSGSFGGSRSNNTSTASRNGGFGGRR